ncbi:MAG: triphosphoribosyl-dephospho-CoA synthase [Candidatus Thiodiazotropha taylori]|uniref:Triphosphoribosyl-dephospho-CoA synthase n=1 Tax=Candidatus Thiodiazotropha taylori TaxID=2792791 RepID=A0A9E4N387_9GAMM|nr:triphosphoribosyl-dephospho-CoA synthase [Candidatus Thiodiazotropha taylori]MCW4255595.1 triphosphoribosyl-dephospho-CoA synthase [Candidatus Thiodiazotropha taylori]
MTEFLIEGGSLREQLEAAYHQACLSELDALKPGNVHRYADGHRMTLEDFTKSADVSAAPLTALELGLGERIFRAVEATRNSVGCNTNLGILMLCAPLVEAMLLTTDQPSGLRDRLCKVLNQATRDDLQWLFRAIRLAAPGGLGESEKHDVNGQPEGDLLEVMDHAADRDMIARQYATGYADLFEFALPRLQRYEQQWQSREWVISGLFMSLLARYPDSHIQRKHGLYKATVVTLHTAKLEEELSRSNNPEHFHLRLLQADHEFKRKGINPGTTADLTVTTLFLSQLESIAALFDPNTGTSRVRDSRPKEVGIRS